MNNIPGLFMILIGAAIGYFGSHFALIRAIYALALLPFVFALAYDFFQLSSQRFFTNEQSFICRIYKLLRTTEYAQQTAAFLCGFLLTAGLRLMIL